jgi:hypothetical protein
LKNSLFKILLLDLPLLLHVVDKLLKFFSHVLQLKPSNDTCIIWDDTLPPVASAVFFTVKSFWLNVDSSKEYLICLSYLFVSKARVVCMYENSIQTIRYRVSIWTYGPLKYQGNYTHIANSENLFSRFYKEHI